MVREGKKKEKFSPVFINFHTCASVIIFISCNLVIGTLDDFLT